MSATIEFDRPDGKKAPGYLAQPSQPDAPGVVLFEEWWGLNDEIKAVADRFAQGGYRTIVPDLFRGKVASSREEAGHMMEGLDFKDAATQDARGAAAYLLAHGARKVGIAGFCVGGALALLAAMHDREFASVATWYGLPPPEAGDPATIAIPVIGHWAAHDEFFTPESVDALEAQLRSSGISYAFHRYDAKHAFSNPHGLGNYDREAAETSWKRTIAFFDRTLKG